MLDSNHNEALSHGFVRFKLKPQATLATGAIINNIASIYFDYNSGVQTNTASTLIKAIVTPVRIKSYELRIMNGNSSNIQNSTFNIQNNWSVGVELNVSHYVVQRSTNGNNFTSVAEVAAQGLNSYTFIDNLPKDSKQTTVYYRLKIVDKDGKFVYSEIRNLEFGIRNWSINIYPNPAKDVLTIETVGGKQLLIIDNLGKTVYQLKVNSEKLIVNTKQFTKGIYIIKLTMNNGDIKTEKLIVE